MWPPDFLSPVAQVWGADAGQRDVIRIRRDRRHAQESSQSERSLYLGFDMFSCLWSGTSFMSLSKVTTLRARHSSVVARGNDLFQAGSRFCHNSFSCWFVRPRKNVPFASAYLKSQRQGGTCCGYWLAFTVASRAECVLHHSDSVHWLVPAPSEWILRLDGDWTQLLRLTEAI